MVRRGIIILLYEMCLILSPFILCLSFPNMFQKRPSPHGGLLSAAGIGTSGWDEDMVGVVFGALYGGGYNGLGWEETMEWRPV